MLLVAFLLNLYLFMGYEIARSVQTSVIYNTPPISSNEKLRELNSDQWLDPSIPDDIQANKKTDYNQQHPSVVARPGGNGFAIAWEAENYLGQGKEIIYRIYFQTLEPMKGEEVVNTIGDGDQERPSITSTRDVGIAVVWQSNDEARSEGVDIFCRMFFANGTGKQEEEFQVNTITDGDQRDPFVSALLNAGIVVIWTSNHTFSEGNDVKARVFDLMGNSVSDEFLVNQFTVGEQYAGGVCGLAYGGFVIVWTSNGQGIEDEVFARIYSNAGVPRTNEFQINMNSYYNQRNPSVACLLDGGFAVTWESDQGSPGVYAKVYNEDGSVRVGDILIDSSGSKPVIAPLDQGGFVVAFEADDGSDTGVFASWYTSYGTSLVSEPIRLNKNTSNRQGGISIAMFDGGFVAAWESGDSDGNGVFFRKYTSHHSEKCASNADCSGTNFTKCRISDGSCVQCLTHDECPDSQCNYDFGRCKACLDNWGCRSESIAKLCNVTLHKCVSCLYLGPDLGSTCTDPTQAKCDLNSYNCTACQADSDCIQISGKPYCESGVCRRCKKLTVGSTCTNSSSPRCDIATDSCKGCLNDNDCLHIPGHPICNKVKGFCQMCTNATQKTNCPVDSPICDSTNFTCRKCLNDIDCGGKYCNVTKGTCQDCLRFDKGSNCPLDTKPRCNPSNFTCQPCIEDEDCPQEKPYCITNTGVCHLCPQGICPQCDQSQYVYLDFCLSECPPGTFLLSNTSEKKCDICITNGNPSNCVSCNTDQDCAYIPLNSVHCSSNRCTTISVKFNNPPKSMEASEILITELLIKGDSSYNLTWLVEPKDINYQVSNSQIKIGPLDNTKQIPVKIKVTAIARNKYNETAEDSFEVTVTKTAFEYSPLQKTAAAAAVGAMFVSGVDPTLLWSLANLMQMFYYLLFLNINYPQNVKKFLGLFSIGRLNFLPNPLAGISEKLQTETLPSPPKFFDNSFTGLFIDTSGSILSTFLVSFTIDLCAHISRCLKGKKNSLSDRIIKFYHWSGYLRLWLSSYLELMFSTLLQIRAFNMSKVHYAFSTILALLVFVANLSLPILSYFILSRIDQNRHNIGRFQALTEDYDLSHPHKKYYIIYSIVRRLLQGLMIVILYHVPLIQVTMVWLVIFGHFIILLILKPHHRQSLNFLDIIIELNFVMIHSLIVPIGYSDLTGWMPEQTKEMVGWIIIGCCFFVLGIQVALILKEQYEAYKGFVKKVIVIVKKYILKKPEPKLPVVIKNRVRTFSEDHKRKISRTEPRDQYRSSSNPNNF